jgi:hypothetical protein
LLYIHFNILSPLAYSYGSTRADEGSIAERVGHRPLLSEVVQAPGRSAVLAFLVPQLLDNAQGRGKLQHEPRALIKPLVYGYFRRTLGCHFQSYAARIVLGIQECIVLRAGHLI